MKIIFDHCVPRPLRQLLPGHEIQTARESGWDKLENGDLILAAEKQFDAMITSDKNLKYQQNLSGRKLAIVILPTNFMPVVLQLAPKIATALAGIRPGDFIEIEAD